MILCLHDPVLMCNGVNFFKTIANLFDSANVY